MPLTYLSVDPATSCYVLISTAADDVTPLSFANPAHKAAFIAHLGITGGGGGAAQLPAWTYTAGAIGDGLFTSDNAAIVATTEIVLSASVIGSYTTSGLASLSFGSRIALIDSAEKVTSFTIGGVENLTDGAIGLAGIGNMVTQGVNWAGKYTLSIISLKQSSADVGLGNVDNVADANKPVSTAQAAADAAVAAAAATSAQGVKADSALQDATAFATAAQGVKADSALQDAAAFATAAQGVKADSALQDATAFATATQGVKADTAVQPADITDLAALRSAFDAYVSAHP